MKTKKIQSNKSSIIILIFSINTQFLTNKFQ